MSIKLSSEQRDAIAESGGRPIVVVDETSNEKFVILDYDSYSWRQCQMELDAHRVIQEGLADREAGRTIPLKEAKRRIEEEFPFLRKSRDAADS
jgi:predicted transcriptional regulator